MGRRRACHARRHHERCGGAGGGARAGARGDARGDARCAWRRGRRPSHAASPARGGAHACRGPRTNRAAGRPVRASGRRDPRVPASSVAACRRLRHLSRAAGRDRAHRERRDAGPHHHRVGQGRHRRARDAQDRRPLARHAHGDPQDDRPRQRRPRCDRGGRIVGARTRRAAGARRPAGCQSARARAGRARRTAERSKRAVGSNGPARAAALSRDSARGSVDLRHGLQGRHDRRVPDRVARADVDAAAAAAALLLRPRGRGGARAPRADPGRHGPSVSPPSQWRGACRVSRRRDPQGARQDARRPALSGAGDVARRRGGGLHAWTGRRAAPRDRRVEAAGQPHRAVRRGPRVGHAVAWLFAQVRAAGVRADQGVLGVRLSRIARCELCAAGLRERVAQAPSPGGVRGVAAQQPADGLLRAGADPSRRARPRRRGARSRRALLAVGLDARARTGSCARSGARSRARGGCIAIDILMSPHAAGA